MSRRTSRPERPWAGLIAGSMAFLAAGCSKDAEVAFVPASSPPNIVLISIDTLRADALSSYGNPRPTSPHIDALAERGVVFEEATTTTSWTLPSHVSMLTGLSISAHGMCDERIVQGVQSGQVEFPMRGTFLSERLSARGYATAGFYSWQYLEPEYGFGDGFDTYTRIGNTVWSDPEQLARYMQLREAGDTAAIQAWQDAEPEAFDDHAPTSHRVVDRSIDWLGERSDAEPFFLFVHLFDTHNDYLPPEGFDRFGTDYTGPIDGSNVAGEGSPIVPEMAAEDLERLVALYHGEVSWVDHQIGRLLDELASQGLDENTIVVLTSDHGEEFFEHGHKIHRTHLFRESVHVPLIVTWPGHLPEGVRVPAPVGIVDIVPTLAELTDLAVPEELSGRSLLPLAMGQVEAERTYLTELIDFSEETPTPRRLVSLREGTKHWFLTIESDGEPELRLVDYERDPEGLSDGFLIRPKTPDWEDFAKRLGAVRVKTEQERGAAAPRLLDPMHAQGDRSAELDAMGYTSSGKIDTFALGDRLCIDGCLFSPAE